MRLLRGARAPRLPLLATPPGHAPAEWSSAKNATGGIAGRAGPRAGDLASRRVRVAPTAARDRRVVQRAARLGGPGGSPIISTASTPRGWLGAGSFASCSTKNRFSVDAPVFAELDAVLLQAKPGKDGRSRSAHLAAPRHRGPMPRAATGRPRSASRLHPMPSSVRRGWRSSTGRRSHVGRIHHRHRSGNVRRPAAIARRRGGVLRRRLASAKRVLPVPERVGHAGRGGPLHPRWQRRQRRRGLRPARRARRRLGSRRSGLFVGCTCRSMPGSQARRPTTLIDLAALCVDPRDEQTARRDHRRDAARRRPAAPGGPHPLRGDLPRRRGWSRGARGPAPRRARHRRAADALRGARRG